MIKLVVKAEVPEGGTKDFSYEFDQPVITMGRLKENDIPLPLSTVSGYHSQILKEEDSYYLMDRGSINGTSLNGQRLTGGEKKLLNDGDIIKIQTFEIYFSKGITMMNIDAGATVQVARQMVMEVLGSWQTNVTEKPRIIVMGGPLNGKKFDLIENKALTVGRVAENDIFIDHPSVSRKHAEISLTWSGAFIKDLKSANGVFVNDQRVVGSQKLRDRDEIRLGQQTSSGPVILVFSNPAEALLSKIDEMQVTDSSPGVAPIPKDGAPAAQAPPAPVAETPAAAAEPAPEAPPAEAAAESPEAALGEEGVEYEEEVAEPAAKKSLLIPLVLVGVAVVVLAAAGAAFYYLWGSMNASSQFAADPVQGSTGDVITLKADSFKPEKLKAVMVLDQPAKVVSTTTGSLRVELPDFPGLVMPQTKTEIVIDGIKGELGRTDFTVLLAPRIRNVSPRSGPVGTEVHIQTNMPAAQPTVLFGPNPAGFKSRTEQELIVIVPRPVDLIPAGGLRVPVTLRINDRTSKNSVEFVVLPESVTPEETFHLTFMAKPYSSPLGFNEHSVETNAGSLLVITAKGAFASSQERAEDAARNLNQAVDYFANNSNARVAVAKEGDHFVLTAEGAASGQKLPLFSAYQDDTLSYAKLSGHPVAIDDLSDWWQMLLDSYFKVFVQVQSPSDSGILSAGGQVFQQIVSFYAIGSEQGKKYYKKELINTLPADQKTKLLALSYNLPAKVLRVDGKWSGSMSNNLYKKLSVQNLELVLTMRQSGDYVSGNAEMNWKIIMGSGDQNFQNVAFRKLGSYSVNGTFRKTKSFPLEFSFTEKEGRRLDFVGKVEGDILYGKFVIASTGDEGTFNLQLQK